VKFRPTAPWSDEANWMTLRSFNSHPSIDVLGTIVGLHRYFEFHRPLQVAAPSDYRMPKLWNIHRLMSKGPQVISQSPLGVHQAIWRG
jgi:hypothetical protein